MSGLPNVFMLVIQTLIMTTKTLFSETDYKLQMMIKRIKLSKSGIKNYNTVF